MRNLLGVMILSTCLGLAGAAWAGQADDYGQANDRMMRDMMMKPSGDADHNFAMMMVPHHQGAVDMAKIELKYGQDPKLRAMAKDIVASQDAQIDDLKAWLAAHPER